MLSPHPASFPGRGLCFRVLSCFPPLDFPGSCPSPDFRVPVPSFPTSLFRFFPASAFGLSRLLSLPGFSGFSPVFSDFPVPVFPGFRLWTFPACVPPRIFGFQFRLSRPPCSGFSGFRLRVFPVSALLFSCPPPVFPGRRCRPGILNLFPAPFFPGRLPAPGFSAVFSGTPTAAAHPPRG